MMTLDDLFFEEDNDSHSRQDDNLKSTKQNLLFKDSMDLVKRKMCTAQNLFKQLNIKEKEYEDLNAELHELKVDREKLFNKYNSASEKLTRLELSNRDYKKTCSDYEKSCNDYKNNSNKQKLELDGKKKHIEQLEFKISEMERDSCHLKDEIKKLQLENKMSKSITKKATRSQACQTNCTRQRDVSINTDFNQTPQKMINKNTMTDRVCSEMNEPITMLCSKCEKQVQIPPLEQILKIMSKPPPPSLTNLFSPPCSPRSIQSNSKQIESIASNAFDTCFNEKFEPISLDKRIIQKTPSREPNGPSFMLLDKLTRKIDNLERLVKKKKHQQNCCHRTCSSSKNIQLVLQLAGKEKLIECAKPKRRKQPHLKRPRKKHFSLENEKHFKTAGWQVENDPGTRSVESQKGIDHLAHEYENSTCLGNTELYESCPILALDSIPGTNSNKVVEPVADKDMVCDDGNDKKEQSSVSSPVLALPSSDINIAKEEQGMDCQSGTVFQTSCNKDNPSPDVLTKKVKSDGISDQSAESCGDLILCSKELNLENINITCRSLNEKQDDVGATALIINPEMQSQEESKETEETQLDSKRISITSSAASDNDELPSTCCMTSAKNSQLAISKPESIQSSLKKVEGAKKTTASRNIKDKISSAIDKMEAVTSPTNGYGSIRNSARKKASKFEEMFGTEDEIDQSSDESLNLRCSTATGCKRRKTSNIIDSGDSGDENSEKVDKNNHRKNLLEKRKKLLSKIRNLKRNSKILPTVPAKQTSDSSNDVTPTTNLSTSSVPAKKALELNNDIIATHTNNPIPKKHRVAHIPKDASEIKQVEQDSLPSDTCKLQKTGCKRASSKAKSPDKMKRVLPTRNFPRWTKKQKLMDNVEPEQNDEKKPSIPAVVKCEPVSATDNSLDMEIKTYSMRNGNDEIHPEENEKDQIAEGNLMIDLLPPQTVIERIESTKLCSEACIDQVPHDDDDTRDENAQVAEPISKSEHISKVLDEEEHTTPTRHLRIRPAVAAKSTRRASRRLQGTNSTVLKSEPDPSIITRSTGFQQPKSKKKSKGSNIPFIEKFDRTNSSLADTFILSHLNDFLSKATNENKQENYACLRNNDKFIREQLSLLMESEPLSEDVFAQVTENLLSINQSQVVAMVLVDYAAMEYLDDTKCNTMYTPPAPPMTKFEQKLVSLITSIKERQPDFVDAVNEGLEYKLFRLAKNPELQNVDRLFRILVVLNKIKKDREKVRMLICDALYCFNSRAINIIHTALTCWSEVFPKHDANNDILVKTIVHVIMLANVNKPFSKVLPLKRLLTDYYGYPNSGFRVENFKQELMNNLKENVPGINTAVLLLCKSKGPEWTLENIIKDLKGMIVQQAHPSMYDALTLLGDLLRPFSSENLKKTLEETTDQLCDVLSGGTGSHDLEEGIVSCLLSVGGKFAFKRVKIAKHILQWQPNQDLRPTTKDKLESFFKTRAAVWWRKFVRQNFPVTK